MLLTILPKDEIAYWEEQGKVEYSPFNGNPKGSAIINEIRYLFNAEGDFYERNLEKGR